MTGNDNEILKQQIHCKAFWICICMAHKAVFESVNHLDTSPTWQPTKKGIAIDATSDNQENANFCGDDTYSDTFTQAMGKKDVVNH